MVNQKGQRINPSGRKRGRPPKSESNRQRAPDDLVTMNDSRTDDDTESDNDDESSEPELSEPQQVQFAAADPAGGSGDVITFQVDPATEAAATEASAAQHESRRLRKAAGLDGEVESAPGIEFSSPEVDARSATKIARETATFDMNNMMKDQAFEVGQDHADMLVGVTEQFTNRDMPPERRERIKRALGRIYSRHPDKVVGPKASFALDAFDALTLAVSLGGFAWQAHKENESKKRQEKLDQRGGQHHAQQGTGTTMEFETEIPNPPPKRKKIAVRNVVAAGEAA